jgi:hypothetical protein
MTRYSASRGIMYTAPPADDADTPTAETSAETESGEQAAADD